MSINEYSWLLSPCALAVLGACVGSFLNVVIHRLPLMMMWGWRVESAELLGVPKPEPAAGENPALNLARPGSRCPHCGHHLAWYENIPLLSWIALRARCSNCNTPISVRYPLVELATAALFAGLAAHYERDPVVLVWCAFGAALIALSAIDWDSTLLPDSITMSLLWGGLLASAFGLTVPLVEAVLGAAAGYLALWSVCSVFTMVTGKVGMGAGDFKLLAALGAWLGWQMLLPVILVSSILGAAFGIGMKASGALREGRYVPFGPFLAGSGLLVHFLGDARITALLYP